MDGKKLLKILVLVLVGAFFVGSLEASFLDMFDVPLPGNYMSENSHGGGGSFSISEGKLNIIPGDDNTFSVITSNFVSFAVGETLSLDVPAVSEAEGVFLMCSSEPRQPDGLGALGFRFRRGGGYAQMHLYPEGLGVETMDPDPSKPATLCIERTSDTDFSYSIIIDWVRTQLGSFAAPDMAGITELHIGAQAYDMWSDTFAFDNLRIHESYDCSDYFMDGFDGSGLMAYTLEDSYGTGGSFEIAGGELSITTGNDNTASVMSTDSVVFCVGETLSLEVPPVSAYGGPFMMCSTRAGTPDGTNTFGFRFRRDGSGYVRMNLYPGGTVGDIVDADPAMRATVCVKRISDSDFEYSIRIEGAETQTGLFSLPKMALVTNVHIGAQAYGFYSGTYSFDNLQISGCGDWGYHPMDFNEDCYVNLVDLAVFLEGWLECTMPLEDDCSEDAI